MGEGIGGTGNAMGIMIKVGCGGGGGAKEGDGVRSHEEGVNGQTPAVASESAPP